MARGTSPQGPDEYSSEELDQQWAFLDAMVGRQAAALRAGAQDLEEQDVATSSMAPEASLDVSSPEDATARITALEDENRWLRDQAAEIERLAGEQEATTAELRRRARQLRAAEKRRLALAAELATVQQQLADRQAELDRLNRSHADLLAALRAAHDAIERTARDESSVDDEPPGVRKPWWPHRDR